MFIKKKKSRNSLIKDISMGMFSSVFPNLWQKLNVCGLWTLTGLVDRTFEDDISGVGKILIDRILHNSIIFKCASMVMGVQCEVEEAEHTAMGAPYE